MNSVSKLLQINVSANKGSTGKIVEHIGLLAEKKGWDCAVAYGRTNNKSQLPHFKIGSDFDVKWHGVETRLLDNHGLASRKATKKFVEWAKIYNPDIVHLHNIHGYYLNYPILFKWLKEWGGPVVWTLHDCWPFTGHCAHYRFSECWKWQTECHNCPNTNNYPKSFIDGSKRNFRLKKESFLSLNDLTLVPVSEWLKKDIKQSFLKDYPSFVIHNGIDIEVFKPSNDKLEIREKFGVGNKKILLGVSSVWHTLKGFDEFKKLRALLPEMYHIILVGLTESQIKELPEGITGISRTNNVKELAELYSAADLFLNPTLEDNFPTTNIEALACGTPVITYNTGGSPEAIDSKTGLVIDYKDIKGFADGIINSLEKKFFSSQDCRDRAVRLFDKDMAYGSYLNLYETLLERK